MEVSSHALVQSRVEGVRFDVAVFTNLSHDHLDFHGSMEDYFAAKASLFEPGRTGVAVVNADDPWGLRLLDRLRVPAVAVRADQVSDVRLEPGRSRFSWRGREVAVPLTGWVNLRNAQLAAEAALAVGIPPDVVADGLACAEPVPGRLEVVAAGGRHPFDVLVDYAHTPAALEAVLAEAERLARPRGGRTVVVFGAGGDRDPTKRPMMGEVAGRMADVVVVTSDNPRGEDPGAIIAAILAGVPEPVAALVEPDRRSAIERAVAAARPGDVVVIAGKGHETYQEVGRQRLPFDDRTVASEALARLGTASAGVTPEG
jgi:UDP-N-acetylmuramoyl-L-alanyl-D-glutamate--2,6-diaminopimelate ligase